MWVPLSFQKPKCVPTLTVAAYVGLGASPGAEKVGLYTQTFMRIFMEFC